MGLHQPRFSAPGIHARRFSVYPCASRVLECLMPGGTRKKDKVYVLFFYQQVLHLLVKPLGELLKYELMIMRYDERIK